MCIRDRSDERAGKGYYDEADKEEDEQDDGGDDAKTVERPKPNPRPSAGISSWSKVLHRPNDLVAGLACQTYA